MPDQQLHFLLLPLPEQGHINPMLSLASHLAALGSTVTFVNVEKAPPAAAHDVNFIAHGAARAETSTPIAPHHPPVQQAINSAASADASTSIRTNLPINATNVRFWTLRHAGRRSSPSPELIDGQSSRFEILKHTLAGLKERQGMVETIVQESKASDIPITCIICDLLLCSWVMGLAKRQAIPAAALVPCGGVQFYMPYLMKLGKREEIEELRLRLRFLGPKETTKKPEETTKVSEVMNFFLKLYDDVEEASHILVNSFKHLESALLGSLETLELNIRFIGPCLPAWEVGDVPGKVGNGMAKQAGCAFTEDESCLLWLDRQEKGSVLLVSFGSEAILEAEQVQELALGIEASGRKFLWVVRPDAPAYNSPQEDFRKRTSDAGMFVSWAPQRRVLQHQAVGGFLTHCGWNSTLESVVFGVPMLCFPMNGDQFINAHLIHAHWKVGLSLGPPRTLVPRADAEKAVRDLMGSDDLRLRSAQLKEAAHRAFGESQSSLISFVQDIASSAHQKLADSLID